MKEDEVWEDMALVCELIAGVVGLIAWISKKVWGR